MVRRLFATYDAPGWITKLHQSWYPTLFSVTQSFIPCGGATEVISDQLPTYRALDSEEEGLLPLDVVFGNYNPDSRLITIYEKNIVHHAKRLGWDPCLLMAVVRLHEGAHALVHLGLPTSLETWLMSPRGGAKQTSWEAYSGLRTAWFRSLDSVCHEYLAQAISYSVLNSLIGETVEEKARYVEMFDAVEAKQPIAYHLSPSEKSALLSTKWEPTLSLLVLHALGADGFMTANPTPLDSPADWREACAELCLINSERTWAIDGSTTEFTVAADTPLFGVHLILMQKLPVETPCLSRGIPSRPP
jgi:hypothetical protein